MIYTGIEELIGNTPLLKLNAKTHGLKNIDVYAKLEHLNPFGSIKDRTVLGLTETIDFQKLKENGVKLIESSSGNTAKALQLIASRNGTKLISVTNRVKVPEVDQLLRYIGTEIISLPGRSECPDPNQDDNALSRIESMVRSNPSEYVHTEQYTNRANPGMHARTTAKELFEDLPDLNYIVASVGTGGSSGGIIDFVHSHTLSTKTIGVVAHPSDFIPGIRTKSELFETPLFKKERFESIEEVTSYDALHALDTLVQNEGLLAGPTTGASFAVLINFLKNKDSLNPDGSRKSAVFIACDRLEPYMSYVMKRLPERFQANVRTDVFSKEVNGEDRQNCEIQADDKLLDRIADDEMQVIDIRGAKPYQAFHIEGAISYPEEILHEVMEQATPFDGNRPVLFVCPKGDRSLLIASVLRDRGLDAYSLAGGLMVWRSSNFPLQRAGRHG